MKMLKDVEAFHRKFGLDYQGPIRSIAGEELEFRGRFGLEELEEMVNSLKAANSSIYMTEYEGNMAQALDAVIDQLYVLLGTAHLMGFKKKHIKKAWKRVHKANMSKVRATREDQSSRGSKLDVVKPEGWKAPCHLNLVSGKTVWGKR